MFANITDSSCIMSYETRGKDLLVEFGKSAYVYLGAAAEVRHFDKVASLGAFFNSQIKSVYEAQTLESYQAA